MKPDFNAGLTYVNASYESIYGLIKSDWKKNKNNLVWKITIPANSSALVYLPTANASDVKVNKQKLLKTIKLKIIKWFLNCLREPMN